MQAYPLKFQPVFKERIWGGSRLRDLGYDIPSDHTGEAWVISDHDHGPSPVANGPLSGWRIGEVMRAYPDWFNVPGERFPLLVKVIDAADDLSVQVHPDDAYARPRGDSGKTEAWYVLDAEPEAKILYGHRAPDRATLERWVNEGAWETLLVEVSAKPGDFFFVPSGTLHAIGRGLLILEIQQSSDTTYRVYDYDRVDAEGKKRELHLDDALAVTRCPSPSPAQYGRARSAKDGAIIDHLVACDVFRIDRWVIDGSAVLPESQTFFLASVLEGSGEIRHFGNCWPVSRGDHLLIPAPLGGAVINGRLTALISTPVISTHRK